MQLFTAVEYLKIDIANNYGLDKKNWSERIKWFDDNYGNLPNLINEASDPALFFAGLKAWDHYLRGIPSGYPISLDATSSGFQILAALTRDISAAKLCNVLDTGKREDSYTTVFDVMTEYLLERLGENAGKISRDDCKKAIMTALYGSQAIPKEVFGEGVQLRIFYEVMRDLAPAAWELNEYFIQIWNPTVTMNSWVLPDNFHVHVKVVDTVCEVVQFDNAPHDTFYKAIQPTEEGRSLGANTTHSIDGMIVREMGRRCNYDPAQIARVTKAIKFPNADYPKFEGKAADMVRILWKHYLDSGFLSARILDYLTEWNILLVDGNVIMDLINTLPKKPFEVVSVHDCFRCLPNYGNDLRMQYNHIMADITRSRMLEFILRQILRDPKASFSLPNPDMWKDVLKADYMLS